MRQKLLVILLGVVLMTASASVAYAAEDAQTLTAGSAALTTQSFDYENYTVGEEWSGTTGSMYLKFKVSEKSHLYAYAETSETRDLYLSIYNMQEQVISPEDSDIRSLSSDGTKRYTKHSCNLDAGDYYIRIRADYYSTTQMKLIVQTEPVVSLSRPTIKSVSSPSANSAKVTISPVTDALSYEYQFSKNSDFSGSATFSHPDTTYTAANLAGGDYYYVRVRPFTVYNDGNKVYGNWSRAKAVNVPAEQNAVTIYTKSQTLKYRTLAKKARTFLVDADDKIGAAFSFAITKVPAAAKKYIKINKSTGVVTVKKGLAKGSYRINVKVTAAATGKYGSASKTATIKVTVK